MGRSLRAVAIDSAGEDLEIRDLGICAMDKEGTRSIRVQNCVISSILRPTQNPD
jgi:hypothetical protein